jgi:hypothetical protein
MHLTSSVLYTRKVEAVGLFGPPPPKREGGNLIRKITFKIVKILTHFY